MFKRSKGELILLLDSDDFFEKDKLKKISNVFKGDPSKECVCDIPKITNIKKKYNRFSNSIFFLFSVTSKNASSRDNGSTKFV